MFFRTGPGSSGYNFQPEFVDLDCHYNIPANGNLPTGQMLIRDCTQFPSTAGADIVVLQPSGNAGQVYGVYQGPQINNPSATNPLPVDITVRRFGQGVVLAASVSGGTAVTVNGPLQANALNPVQVGGGGLGGFVGSALATGSVTARGATLIAVPGSGSSVLLVNCAINCQ